MSYPSKRGLVLVRDSTKPAWNQRIIEFDPTKGEITLRESPTGPPNFTGKISKKDFQVKPSPYRIPTMPDSVGLHVYPVKVVPDTQPEDAHDEESVDIHFTIMDRQAVLDWSYYLRGWLASSDSATAAESEDFGTPIGREGDFGSLSAPLTMEEQTIASRVLGAADTPDEAGNLSSSGTVIAKKFNAEISIKTVQCLRRSEWLTDEIINYYFQLLQQYRRRGGVKIFSWSSFFWTKLSSNEKLLYNFNGVKNWTTRKEIDLFDSTKVEVILIPLNIDKAHWALGVVDMRNRTTHYLDSLDRGIDFDIFHEYMGRYMEDEWKRRREQAGSIQTGTSQVTDLSSSDDDVVNLAAQKFRPFNSVSSPPDLPLQQNGNDCGIFVSLFGLAIASGIPIEKLGEYKRSIFSVENILNARKRVLSDIVRGEIVR